MNSWKQRLRGTQMCSGVVITTMTNSTIITIVSTLPFLFMLSHNKSNSHFLSFSYSILFLFFSFYLDVFYFDVLYCVVLYCVLLVISGYIVMHCHVVGVRSHLRSSRDKLHDTIRYAIRYDKIRWTSITLIFYFSSFIPAIFIAPFYVSLAHHFFFSYYSYLSSLFSFPFLFFVFFFFQWRMITCRVELWPHPVLFPLFLFFPPPCPLIFSLSLQYWPLAASITLFPSVPWIIK